MMKGSARWRRSYWIGGGTAAIAAVVAASRGGAGAAQWIAPALVVVAWAGFGIAASAIARRRLAERIGGECDPAYRAAPEVPRDDRPADGEVGVVPIEGVTAAPGPPGSEFRRFVALEPLPGEAPFRNFRIWGRRFPPLLGRVAILSIFVGRDGRSWSDDEIAKAHRALKRAGAWIEREAIRWRVPVNVDLADTYFSSVEEDAGREVAVFRPDEWGGVGLPDPDAEARILGILGRSAAALGFADPVDLLGRIGRRVEADQIVWLLHVRRAGKSIALPSDATGIPGVAVAVCYAREEDFEAPLPGPPFADPITFVHELMHLFGATDKYDESLASFPRGTVSERDVMVLGFEALSRLNVDPLTAVEIGWASSPTDRPAGPSRPLRTEPEGGRKERRPRRPR